jgi:hypothetical protein
MATMSRWTSITRSALFAMLAVPSALGKQGQVWGIDRATVEVSQGGK